MIVLNTGVALVMFLIKGAVLMLLIQWLVIIMVFSVDLMINLF